MARAPEREQIAYCSLLRRPGAVHTNPEAIPTFALYSPASPWLVLLACPLLVLHGATDMLTLSRHKSGELSYNLHDTSDARRNSR